MAIPCPIPLPAPVTNATSSLRLNLFIKHPPCSARLKGRELHDGYASSRFVVEYAAVNAAAKDHHLVRKAKHLVEVGAHDDNGHALACEFSDNLVDGCARAQFDARGWPI